MWCGQHILHFSFIGGACDTDLSLLAPKMLNGCMWASILHDQAAAVIAQKQQARISSSCPQGELPGISVPDYVNYKFKAAKAWNPDAMRTKTPRPGSACPDTYGCHQLNTSLPNRYSARFERSWRYSILRRLVRTCRSGRPSTVPNFSIMWNSNIFREQRDLMTHISDSPDVDAALQKEQSIQLRGSD